MTATRPNAKAPTIKQSQADAARTTLRDLLPPGTTVYTILRHTSRSGMQRRISVVVPYNPTDTTLPTRSPLDIDDITYLVARAADYKVHPDGGLIVNGCGMDMGFSVVYDLSSVLYPEGFGCIGDRCPSNDHSNGDRDYTPHGIWPEAHAAAHPEVRNHWHQSGGYALKQRWI